MCWAGIVFLTFLPLVYAYGGSGTFLYPGAGARGLSMGSSFVAIADDAYAPLWNPAGLSQIEKPQVGSMYSDKFGLGIKNQFLSLVYPGCAISIFNTSIDNIPRTEWNGDQPQQIGSFSDEENAVFLSLSFRISNSFSLGINGKYLYQKLYNKKASGASLDVAGFFQPTNWLSLGINVQNIGRTKFKWNTFSSYSDTILQNIKAGLCFHLWKDRLLLALDIDKTQDKKPLYHLGTETHLFKSFFLRAGFCQYSDNDSLKDTWTAGMGVRINIIQLDYACVSHPLGTSHIFSLSLNL